MALVGYARVSSVGQSLDVQLGKLRQCNKIFQEKKSAVSGHRPSLRACLDYVREGDTLVVTRLDRLARSTRRSKAAESRRVTRRIGRAALTAATWPIKH